MCCTRLVFQLSLLSASTCFFFFLHQAQLFVGLKVPKCQWVCQKLLLKETHAKTFKKLDSGRTRLQEEIHVLVSGLPHCREALAIAAPMECLQGSNSPTMLTCERRPGRLQKYSADSQKLGYGCYSENFHPRLGIHLLGFYLAFLACGRSHYYILLSRCSEG